MYVKHEFKIKANCPVDGEGDIYDAVFEPVGMVFVEDIRAILEEAKTSKVPQEELTLEIARRLGGTLTTVGWHSGIKTTVVAR